jgi:hypothetical protein
MLRVIVLSTALFILAVTGSSTVLADAAAAKSPTVGQQTPAFRAFASTPDNPNAIDVPIPDESLLAIAVWLSENFELPGSTELPRIEFAAPAQMNQLRYKGLMSDRIDGAPATQNGYVREVVAVYDDSTRTIYLPRGWTGATPSERSVLVHEMVHHLQNLAGLKYACGGAREKPAYLAQRKWLDVHDLDLEKEFDVDMFTIVALSACMG